MAFLHPFRALRPTPDSARLVASVPYDVVTRDEAAALASGNPLSFLHVSRPDMEFAHVADPHAPEVYRVAVENLQKLRLRAPLVVEEDPSLYVYRLSRGDHEQVGLAGCFSLDEYDQGIIKKHEHTRHDKEVDRTRHMVALHAQTGLAFLTYRAEAAVDARVARVTKVAPLIDFHADDDVRHTIWRATPHDRDALVQAFKGVPALYIADGHHRIASADRARMTLRRAARHAAAELADDPGVAEADTFIAVAFPHDVVRILPYNRVVRGLGGRSSAAFLDAVREVMPVAEGTPAPARRGRVSMYLDGRWYELAVQAEGGESDDLDVSRLGDLVIAPLLGIEDVRADPRIEFVGGARGTGEIERLVDAGDASVGFSLYPVTVEDLMAVADAGGIMPPKSTWFEPKVRDGLLSHVI
jgi:uncharacterized protein (DUF1015 family)